MADSAIAPSSPVTARSSAKLAYAVIVAGCAIAFVLELMLGTVQIPLSEVVSALARGSATQEVWSQIVLQFRLPRAINAALCGAALGACGLILQTLFRNPLADPYVLGIVFGSRLGVALLVVFTGVAGNAYVYKYGLIGDVGTAVASAGGTLGVLLLLLVISKRVSTVTLLVVGLMIGYLCVGLISVFMHFVDETQARAFQVWDDGSFAGVTAAQLRILAPAVALGVMGALGMIKSLNSLLLGENYAQSLGTPVRRVRLLAFLCVALLGGTVTAFCGPIAFLGLVVAHLCRLMLNTSDHRVLMPAVLLTGSLMALTADLITHLPWSRHFLHLNAVNGLIGAPVVLWVLLRPRQGRSVEL